jgi:DNA-directed RNA polymerase subunit RPC12/RpoP
MFHSIWHDGKRGMVEAAAALLGEADAVVHYNGKSFDIPTLCKDFLLELGKPPTPFHQIDLLHVVRKRFRFASNKLDFVARQLGIGKKLPHKGMDLWRGCMHGNPKDQKVMERYNIQDVLLLEKLYERLLPWINKHPNHGLYTDEERPVCTNCGSRHVVKNGVERLATQAYQRYRCQKCGTPLRGRTTILTKEKRAAILTQSKL